MNKQLKLVVKIISFGILLFSLTLAVNWVFLTRNDVVCTGNIVKVEKNFLLGTTNVTNRPSIIELEYHIHSGPWYKKTRANFQTSGDEEFSNYLSAGYSNDDKSYFSEWANQLDYSRWYGNNNEIKESISYHTKTKVLKLKHIYFSEKVGSVEKTFTGICK